MHSIFITETISSKNQEIKKKFHGLQCVIETVCVALQLVLLPGFQKGRDIKAS
jgi:hypothetical protein